VHHRTVIAADIAKTSFQCIRFRDNQPISKSKSYKRAAFEKLITTDKPMTLIPDHGVLLRCSPLGSNR
jgi:hypothetical protein